MSERSLVAVPLVMVLHEFAKLAGVTAPPPMNGFMGFTAWLIRCCAAAPQGSLANIGSALEAIGRFCSWASPTSGYCSKDAKIDALNVWQNCVVVCSVNTTRNASVGVSLRVCSSHGGVGADGLVAIVVGA